MLKQNFFLLIVVFFISCSLNSNYLPEDFFGLQLTKKLTGKEAKEFVNNLHFQSVADLENEIGFYDGEAGVFTLSRCSLKPLHCHSRNLWKRNMHEYLISPKPRYHSSLCNHKFRFPKDY